MQGNIYQRYEYWNFGDYWGLGYDSIIDWRAWPPTFPITIEYPGIGTYTTTLLDSNLCGIDVATITIQIVPPPTADAAVDAVTICEGEVVTFENNSSGNATDFAWNFDDGTPEIYSGAATIDHVFQNPGNYNVSLIAAVGGVGGGCADTAYVPITVEPAPVADIILDNDSACDVLDVNFTDNSTGSISSWEWNFGNSSTSLAQNPPTITYNTPGSYNVVLTVEAPNGCRNSDTEIVTVYESPVADFLISDVCIGSEGTFTDLSSSAAGDPITSWEWDFGDLNTSTDQNPTHTYNTAGTYTVTLTVNTDHCSATTSTTINVVEAPTSDFTGDVLSGCAPLDVNFSNNSIAAVNYTWIFGDGGGSGDENPAHTFENFGDVDSVYTVQLIAINPFGCRDTSELVVTVHPNAVSQFQTFYTPGCSPAPANFLNNSINADSYTWNFGDVSLQPKAVEAIRVTV
jgi:PKD repeat protein